MTMPACEMCGKTGELFKALVEGTELIVCNSCGKHGKVLSRQRTEIFQHKKVEIKKEAPTETLIDNFGETIKKEREKRKMTQKEFASLLKEKESSIPKIETGEFKPTLETAKNYEKLLKIKLIEIKKFDAIEPQKHTKSSVLTIGDIIEKDKLL